MFSLFFGKFNYFQLKRKIIFVSSFILRFRFKCQWVLVKFLIFQHQQLVPKMCTYYVHGNSNPILKNLLPVTVANILPPLLRKNSILCWVRWARVLHIVLYFHHFGRVSQQICHLDHFLLCHNKVSRRSRMFRLIYICDNLE